MDSDKFWALTYAELDVILNGYVERRKDHNNELLYLAWHTALFTRQEYKLPKFEEIITPKEKKQKQTDEEMMAMARILNAAFGGTEVTV